MGSKLQLLEGQLGDTILEIASQSDRFVDLFAGSGSVSHFVAENVDVPVLSNDLQFFSSPLALSVTGRTSPLNGESLIRNWIIPAMESYNRDPKRVDAEVHSGASSRDEILKARRLSTLRPGRMSPIWRDYGGHYFSPRQALAMDHLLRKLPTKPSSRNVSLAALLHTASACAASPGHTAQPFQPTPSLLRHIQVAWARDVFFDCERLVLSLAARHANVVGRATSVDSLTQLRKLNAGDVVFCDPPYSNAQYSRFYHVLEGIAIGGWPSVSGAGRAPSLKERAASEFSQVSTSQDAFNRLFDGISKVGATGIVTFPAGAGSNGITGQKLRSMAESRFFVSSFQAPHVHSTLGGSSEDLDVRGARRGLNELVLILRPRAQK